MREGILLARKLANKICIVAIIFGLLSGCMGAEKPTALNNSAPNLFTEPVYDWTTHTGETLTFWAQDPDLDRLYLNRAIKRYEEKTGNTLQLTQIPHNEFEQVTTEAFSGDGEKPDILLSYGGINLEPFHPDENFYDFTRAQWVDDLTGTSINQTIYNGKVFGLPHWEASISGTLYNKEIFQKLDLQIPQNQEEFLEVCAVLLENGITPMYLPYKEISMLLYQFPLDSIVQDTEILEALNNGQIGYADLPEMKIVLEWYRTMAERDYFGTDFAENDWDGMDPALHSGQYAMMLCWDTWLYTDFTGNPSNFGLMPAFMGIPDEGTFEGPNLALLLVNKNSPRVDVAVEFITFLADPYNYNEAFKGIYTAPVFKRQVASISTPQYVEAERLIDRNFRDSTAWVRIKGFSQQDASCIQKYMTGTDGYTAEQCLQDMDQLRQERASQ